MNDFNQRLIDLGERRILREIIPEYVTGAGDDCASITIAGGTLVITTDPVPQPAALVIGGDSDPYWAGWLLVTINASDIAASGATPLSFVAALDLPNDFLVEDLRRLLAGIRDSCNAHSLAYIGGNLREADKFSAVGTAVGWTGKAPLSRRGADAGDSVVVIGRGGLFWEDVLRVRAAEAIERESSPLFAPVAQVHAMEEAHSLGLLKCAMDTSDGLAPTLHELALVNGLSVEISLEALRRASRQNSLGVRPERLWMGWGDWTVVTAVSAAAVSQLKSVLKENCAVIGSFDKGKTTVTLHDGQRAVPLARLESERFAKDSWFASGIEAYQALLEELPLP